MPLSIGNTNDDVALDDVFLLYHAASEETGERLGQYLGVPHGTSYDHGNYETVIRWGGRQRIPADSSVDIVQPKQAIANASDKFNALQTLDDAGVNIPRYTRDRDELGPNAEDYITYPALGRSQQHTQGNDIELIMQWRDAYLTDGNHHFVDYIPTELEYRVHVIDDEVIKVHEKRLRREADNHPYIRNQETGWVFVNPREEEPDHQLAIDAVDALDLDFGAVDIIRAEETGEEYVLEVNTAPSLDENNLERYGNALADQVGLSRSDLAGLSSVEWDEEGE